MHPTGDTLAGYRSLLHGQKPVLNGYESKSAELDGLVAQVRQWLQMGVEAPDIAVTARQKHSLEAAQAALLKAGVPSKLLRPDLDDGTDGGVRLATMHRMKGLEYRCVAVVDADRANLPLAFTLTPESVDKVQHAHEVQRERCLLYVACSRARDMLWVGWSGTPTQFIEATLGSG